MSVNVTIAVPLETVIAIQSATNVDNSINAVADVTAKTTRAVIDAVKCLPYELAPKGAGSTTRTTTPAYSPATSSFDGNEDRPSTKLAYYEPLGLWRLASYQRRRQGQAGRSDTHWEVDQPHGDAQDDDVGACDYDPEPRWHPTGHHSSHLQQGRHIRW